MFYNYIIENQGVTYNGYTNDLKHRLRQHNGEIVGGARMTTRRVKYNRSHWDFLVTVSCPTWSAQDAMKFEWNLRYPNRKKPRPKEFNGLRGRLDGLVYMLNAYHAEEEVDFFIHVQQEWYEYIKHALENAATNKNVHLFVIEEEY